MRKEFLPFCKPSISPEEIQAVTRVLQSGWITTGAANAAFEEAFQTMTGARNAVCMTSETSVMQALLQALDIGPGDEVITPSMTWVSLPNCVALRGAKAVFIDCDPDTLMVTPQAVEAAITPRTRLIVPVHFAGGILDIDGLRAVAARHHIMLVEDGAHALGGAYKGRKIGKTGHVMFSFHPIKNITCGEGGMFVTDDDALARRMRSLKFHGLAVDAYDRQTQGRLPQAQVLEPGFKFNLTDLQAALGLSQLKRLEELNGKRKALHELYMKKLPSIPALKPLAFPDYEFTHAYHLMAVRILPEIAGISRDEMMAELKAQNIGTGLHFRCVHTQTFYRQTYPEISLPATEWNSDRIFSLPLFPDMTASDVNDVIEAIRQILS